LDSYPAKNAQPFFKAANSQNFIRSLEALDGKTPAEACGIKVEGENKWKTLIQNASKKT
jgi:hypothetical protein